MLRSNINDNWLRMGQSKTQPGPRCDPGTQTWPAPFLDPWMTQENRTDPKLTRAKFSGPEQEQDPSKNFFVPKDPRPAACKKKVSDPSLLMTLKNRTEVKLFVLFLNKVNPKKARSSTSPYKKYLSKFCPSAYQKKFHQAIIVRWWFIQFRPFLLLIDNLLCIWFSLRGLVT